jgi:hypothetical protein
LPGWLCDGRAGSSRQTDADHAQRLPSRNGIPFVLVHPMLLRKMTDAADVRRRRSAVALV